MIERRNVTKLKDKKLSHGTRKIKLKIQIKIINLILKLK